MQCTGDKSLGGHRALLCRGRGDLAGKQLSKVIGTERRQGKHHSQARSYPLSASPTGLRGDHSGGVNGQRLPCGVLSLRGRHRAPYRPTARLCHSPQPLGRCCLAPQGALAALSRRGRWALPLGSGREAQGCVLAGLQVVLSSPVQN